MLESQWLTGERFSPSAELRRGQSISRDKPDSVCQSVWARPSVNAKPFARVRLVSPNVRLARRFLVSTQLTQLPKSTSRIRVFEILKQGISRPGLTFNLGRGQQGRGPGHNKDTLRATMRSSGS